MGSVLVIGGGAAGLAAAIAAAECGDTVTVAEKMDRVGKKSSRRATAAAT